MSLSVEVLSSGGALFERYRYAPAPAAETPRHVHDAYQWCLSIDFPGFYLCNGGSVAVPAGALSVLHPGEPHGARDPHDRLTPAHYLVAYFGLSDIAELGSELAGKPIAEPHFRSVVIADVEVRDAFARMHAAHVRAPPGLERDESRLRFLSLAVARHTGVPMTRSRPVSPRVVRVVKEYLHEHVAEPVALGDLASLVGLSPFHLHRVFSRAVGLPPHRYQVGLRIERAKQLLASGADPSRAAASTGFADYSHLSRHFRRVVGISPARYRILSKNVQEGRRGS